MKAHVRDRAGSSKSRAHGGLAVLVAVLSVAFVPMLVRAGSPALEARASETPSATQVAQVLRVGFTVADLDRSIAFFTNVLGFERSPERPVREEAGDELEALTGVFASRARSARLRLGDEEIELTEFLAPSDGLPFPADSRANDLWFQHLAIVVSDLDAAYEKLREHHVRHASSGPQRLPDWNPAAGGIEAFYFRDPDGHFLELIEYPKGKGDPRWQEAQGRLFLGIDHTAIVVDDTDRSLAFYRDRLGLRVAGTSENHGIEQERLNGVFGARLRITGLRAPGRGPGIELLEYLVPSNGRPRPTGARANDLLYWHVDLRLAEASAEAAYRSIPVDSPRVVEAPDLGRAFTAADPDGHRLRFVAPSSDGQAQTHRERGSR